MRVGTERNLRLSQVSSQDLRMPHGSGLDVARARGSGWRHSVIVMTACGSIDEAVQADEGWRT